LANAPPPLVSIPPPPPIPAQLQQQQTSAPPPASAPLPHPQQQHVPAPPPSSQHYSAHASHAPPQLQHHQPSSIPDPAPPKHHTRTATAASVPPAYSPSERALSPPTTPRSAAFFAAVAQGMQRPGTADGGTFGGAINAFAASGSGLRADDGAREHVLLARDSMPRLRDAPAPAFLGASDGLASAFPSASSGPAPAFLGTSDVLAPASAFRGASAPQYSPAGSPFSSASPLPSAPPTPTGRPGRQLPSQSQQQQPQSQQPKPLVLPSLPPIALAPPPLPYRHLTLDAAQWTLSSAELQGVVSAAIRESAREKFIQLLAPSTEADVRAHAERTEADWDAAASTWRFEARRRDMLLKGLAALSGGGCAAQQDDAEATQALLAQLNGSLARLDGAAEGLLRAGAHRAQLAAARDTHRASALAVALRKLNASYARRTRELEREREKRHAAQGEVEEAWRVAEEVAAEVDRLRARELARIEGRVERGAQTACGGENVYARAHAREEDDVDADADADSLADSMDADSLWARDGTARSRLSHLSAAEVVPVVGTAVRTPARAFFARLPPLESGARAEGERAAVSAGTSVCFSDSPTSTASAPFPSAAPSAFASTVPSALSSAAPSAFPSTAPSPFPTSTPTPSSAQPHPNDADSVRRTRRGSGASQVSRVSAARTRSMRASKASLRLPPAGRAGRSRASSRARPSSDSFGAAGDAGSVHRRASAAPAVPARSEAGSFLEMGGQGVSVERGGEDDDESARDESAEEEGEGGEEAVLAYRFSAPALEPTYAPAVEPTYAPALEPTYPPAPRRPRSPTTLTLLDTFSAHGPASSVSEALGASIMALSPAAASSPALPQGAFAPFSLHGADSQSDVDGEGRAQDAESDVLGGEEAALVRSPRRTGGFLVVTNADPESESDADDASLKGSPRADGGDADEPTVRSPITIASADDAGKDKGKGKATDLGRPASALALGRRGYSLDIPRDEVPRAGGAIRRSMSELLRIGFGRRGRRRRESVPGVRPGSSASVSASGSASGSRSLGFKGRSSLSMSLEGSESVPSVDEEGILG
ncbi:hypothetical protein K488DRAFT_73916, partial [Vararia minispora EC-137]